MMRNLEEIINESPILKEIQSMSQDLSAISSIGLAALQLINENKIADETWVNNSIEAINKAKISRGQVELMVVSPIEKLVLKAGGK